MRRQLDRATPQGRKAMKAKQGHHINYQLKKQKRSTYTSCPRVCRRQIWRWAKAKTRH